VRVRFEAAVLEQPAQHGRDLTSIIDRCDRGQHRWVIDDLDSVLDSVLDSAWMKGRASWDVSAELAKKVFQAQILVPQRANLRRLMVVTVDEHAAAQSTETTKYERPARARAILEQAVQLILENGTADWHFVCAMSQTYPQPDLMQAIHERWIVPEHAGGKGDFKKRFDELRRREMPPWRIAALMDSDKSEPDKIPAANEKLRKQLEDLGVKVFVLFKREAENYLPPSLLRDKRTVLSSLLRLTPEQRDYYDMKKGFDRSADGRGAALSEAEQRVFGNVDAWNQNRLVGGFGGSIGAQFKDAVIGREEMEDVCSTYPGEIERILRTLEEML
jgi:hypothetical protein